MNEPRPNVEHPEIADPRERAVLGLDPLPAERAQATPAEQPAPHELPIEEPEGKPLTPRELAFIEAYTNGQSTASDAYAKAYPEALTASSQRSGAHRLLRLPRVAAEIARIRAEARAELHYDIVEATREIDEKIAGAEAAGQWSAVANLMQHKMKLHALLVDRAEVKQSSFSLTIVEPGSPVPAGNVIDVTPIPPLLEEEPTNG